MACEKCLGWPYEWFVGFIIGLVLCTWFAKLYLDRQPPRPLEPEAVITGYLILEPREVT